MTELGLSVTFGLFCLLLVLIICWIVLPIAVIGTKPILREILQQQRETNAHLTALSQHIGQGVRPDKPSTSELARVYREKVGL